MSNIVSNANVLKYVGVYRNAGVESGPAPQ